MLRCSSVLFVVSTFALFLANTTNKVVASGNLRTVILSDQPAPGTPPGVQFSYLEVPQLDNNGRVAVYANLTGPGVDGTNSLGVWSETGGGGFSLVARAGDAAPGAPAGIVFQNFNTYPVLIAGGVTAFHGFTSDFGDGI